MQTLKEYSESNKEGKIFIQINPQRDVGIFFCPFQKRFVLKNKVQMFELTPMVSEALRLGLLHSVTEVEYLIDLQQRWFASEIDYLTRVFDGRREKALQYWQRYGLIGDDFTNRIQELLNPF